MALIHSLAGVNGSHPLGVSGFVLKLSLDTPTSAAALLGGSRPLCVSIIVARALTSQSPRRRDATVLHQEGVASI